MRSNVMNQNLLIIVIVIAVVTILLCVIGKYKKELATITLLKNDLQLEVTTLKQQLDSLRMEKQELDTKLKDQIKKYSLSEENIRIS